MEGVPLVVRLNELTGRAANPHVPWTPEEIAREAAACVDAGATVVHFHGRTVDGAADPSGETLSRTLDLIADACDAVTYCTLGAGQDQDRDTRMATLTGSATKPDIAPVDLGSFNLDPYDAEARRFVVEEGLYVNTVGTVRHLAAGIQAEGVTPAAVSWTIGSLRLLGALLDEGTWRSPVFAELVVSDRLLVTNPASPMGVEHLVAHLPAADVDWTLLCAGGSILPLVEVAVAAGGGLAFGLGDHPYLELGEAPRNADVVAAVVERLERLGRRPATPKELRARLA